MSGSNLPVFILFGPTASGKTEILESLFAGAGAFCPAEIISADSMQVYRGMDIGTAKPGAQLRAALPHHLIDICEPDEQFNAGTFVRLAQQTMCAINSRGALSVISGGTGFYLSNFMYGLPAAPPASTAIRAQLKSELADGGKTALRQELFECDPVSAERIHEHDELRLIRALEVYRLTGLPLSSYQSFSTAPLKPAETIFALALECPRDDLYQRINLRCRMMFKAGLREEVTALYKKGLTPAAPGLKAIGYREFFVQDEDGYYRLLGAEHDREIEELTARNSRHYAKRQITYVKHLGPSLQWITIGETASSRKQAAAQIQTKLARFIEGQEQRGV